MFEPLPSRRRRAFTLLEIAVASALLAVLLLVITQTMSAVERHMQRTDERAQAAHAVENLMEQVTQGSWNDVTNERIADLKLPSDIMAHWPKATLEGDVTEVTEPVIAKRVTLTLKTGGVVRDRPVTLTTWIFRTPQK